MYNILNSISFVNLYTELATPSCCCGVFFFFFKSGIQMCTTAIIIKLTIITNKYADLRIGLRSLYSGHKVSSVEVIFDFLAAYSTHLENKLTKILQNKRVVSKTIEKSQKWIISQNCVIVKRFASFF